MRKSTYKAILSLIVVTIFIQFGFVAEAVPKEKLEVKTEVGFNNNYKVGYSTPVTLNLKNGDSEINGEIEIRVPSTSGKYISYVRTLSLDKNAEKVVTINVPVNGYRIKYKVLISNGKDTVYEDQISFNSTQNNITQFIGILSDDSDSLTYINKIPSAMGITVQTKNIKLTEKNFPEEASTMSAFDLIIINNFDTSKLNKVQYEVLKQWVIEGGTLIVGTGNNYNKTLGLFADDFIKGRSKELSTVNTSKIYELASNGDNKKAVPIDVMNIEVEGAFTSLEDNGIKLVQAVTKGKGYAAVAAFDFGQSPFTEWSNNTTFAEKLIGAINPNIVDLATVKGVSVEQNTNMLRQTLNQFSEMAPINTNRFYWVLLIYIIVVAPINYFVLKKLDKREFMWVTVPVLSMVFGIVVYISGFGTRLSKTTTNIVSVINLDSSGSATTKSYVGIFNPKKSKINVESKNGQNLVPISDFYYDYNNQNITNEEPEAKVYTGNKSRVEYYNTSILQTKMLQLQKGTVELGNIEANIRVNKGSLEGTIYNDTKLDLEDCYILSQGEYYKLGSINKRESKTIGKREGIYNNNIHELINNIYNSNITNYPGVLSDSQRKQRMENEQKASMLRFQFENGLLQIKGITLIGFSRTSVNDPLIINGTEASLNERNLIVMSIKPSFKSGENIEYPKGFVPSTIIQSGMIKYDNYNNMMYGNGSAEIVYSIDQNMIVEEIYLETNFSNYGNVGLVISLYNLQTNQYEEFKKDTIKDSDISKYMGSDNKLRLRVDMKDGSCPIPLVGAKGKVK